MEMQQQCSVSNEILWCFALWHRRRSNQSCQGEPLPAKGWPWRRSPTHLAKSLHGLLRGLWLRCHLQDQIGNGMKSQAYRYTIIINENVPELLRDIYAARMYAWYSRAMIPVHRQEPDSSNQLVVPHPLLSDVPRVHLNEDAWAPVSVWTLGPQDFWELDIWMMVKQIKAVQHTLFNLDSEHALSLKRLSKRTASTAAKVSSWLLLSRLSTSHYLQWILYTKKVACGRWLRAAESELWRAGTAGTFSLLGTVRRLGISVGKWTDSGRPHLQGQWPTAFRVRDHYCKTMDLSTKLPIAGFTWLISPWALQPATSGDQAPSKEIG